MMPSTLAGAVQLSILDWAVIACYLIVMVLVVVWLNRRARERGDEDSESFFLGGRSMPWWAIGCSLFASNVGTDHLVGLAGSGAAGGMAVGMYEWNAAYILMILGFAFVPHYLACQIYTVPEYLEKRFSKGLKDFFMVITILATFFTKITVTIFAGAVVLEAIFGWNMWLSSVILLVLTTIYTSVGGLAAVMFTEVLQVGVLLVGCTALLSYGMAEVGGWGALQSKLPESYFSVVRPNSDPDFPWLGVLVGMPINSIWYWCTDQVMVQRALGTDNPAEAQKGCVLASWLKILPMFIMVMPGLIAAALFPTEIAADSNQAFPLLVANVMPAGLIGVMVAAMLSSFMAALASCFNSCSTLFTMDIYKVMYPDASEDQLVRAGRVFTLLIGGFSLLWLPAIMNSQDQLFLYIQAMQNIWCGPICTIFVASVMSKRVTTFAAWVSLGAGLFFGTFFWAVQNLLTANDVSGSPFLLWVHELAILLYAPISCAISVTALLMAMVYESHRRTPEETPILASGQREKYDELYEKQVWAGYPTRACAVGCLAVVCCLIAFFA